MFSFITGSEEPCSREPSVTFPKPRLPGVLLHVEHLIKGPLGILPNIFLWLCSLVISKIFFSSGFLALGSWKGSCASLIAHWFLSHRIEELTCGGMVEQVQEAFGETMTSVVSLCARYPIACANSIGLLCTIPYTR